MADPTQSCVVVHGGAGSWDTKEHDGPETAAQAGLAVLQAGGSARDAAVAATRCIEDDPRFNAGTGSNLRFDGISIEMDAALMTSDGRYGAVTCLREARNPIDIAADVWATPHNCLAGAGADAYARTRGHAPAAPVTDTARAKFQQVMQMLRDDGVAPGWCDWDLVELREHWNLVGDLDSVLAPGDTVGAVVRHKGEFAAALSTGGTIATLLGRVGDVPMIGCGLFAGPAGAVCVTGDGDHLARARLAGEVYDWMDAGATPDECVAKATTMFPEPVAVGLILINETGLAGGSNLAMAWAQASLDRT